MKINLNKKIKGFVLLALITVLVGMCSVASAASTYSGGTITITGGTNTLSQVYSDISNPSVLSKVGNEYTLNADILVSNPATLIIEGETLKFGGVYRIWNRGSLVINNSVITSVNPDSRGRILNRFLRGDTGWVFQLTNSDVSYLGPGGLDEYGEYRYGIFGYPAQEDEGIHAREPVIISNNNIHHINYIAFGKVNQEVTVNNNSFHEMEAIALQIQTGLVEENTFYNNTNDILIYSYGNPTIKNNLMYNNHLTNTGAMIELKEGSGGIQIINNTIRDSSIRGSGYAIVVLGSNHIIWSTIKDNIIRNVTNADGIYIQGNGYLGGFEVKAIVENNTIDKVNRGIYFSGYSNFPGYAGNQAPRNVTLKNNRITGSMYGIFVNGDPYLNVSSINDIIELSNTVDLKIGNDLASSSQMPKFINTKYSTVTVKDSNTFFYYYHYLDVKVVDSSGNPISGATVTVANNIDTNYPSININGEIKHSFTTGMDGHTPLPSNPASSAAILDFWKTSSSQQEMTYTITASYNGSTNSTTITPDATWYRADPNIYQNTVTIVLPIIGTLPIDINQDGAVDISDLRLVALHFGETTALPYPRYDVNADGTVDILDLRQVAGGM